MSVGSSRRPVGWLRPDEARQEYRQLRIRQAEARAAVRDAEARLDADWTSEALARQADEAWRRLLEVNQVIKLLRRNYPAEFGEVEVL